MSDIIKLSQQGNIGALNKLYHDNKFKAFKLAYLLTFSVEDANKAVEYAFTSVWDDLLSCKIKTEEEFETTIINKAVFYSRSKILNDNPKAFKVPENNNFTNVKYIKNKDCEEISKADLVLASLPEIHRFIFVLNSYANFSANKIAQILKTNKETIEIALNTKDKNIEKIINVNFCDEINYNYDLFSDDITKMDTQNDFLKENDIIVEEKIKKSALPFIKYKNKKAAKKGIIIGIVAAVVLVLGLLIIKGVTGKNNTSGEPITDVTGLNPTHYAEIDIKDYGTVTVALDENIAPITVKNFVKLANDGFYDGLTFHRIIDGFMMQGGDPEGNGTGGSDEDIIGEFAANGYENPISHTRGAISMARSNDYNSGSSQFFIMHKAASQLDGNYAAFGYVTEGMNVVDKICEQAEPTDNNGTISADKQPIINYIKITER